MRLACNQQHVQNPGIELVCMNTLIFSEPWKELFLRIVGHPKESIMSKRCNDGSSMKLVAEHNI